VTAVGKLVQKIGKRQLYTKGETIHKRTQKHRMHKIENKHTEQEKRTLSEIMFLKYAGTISAGYLPRSMVTV